MSILKTLRKAYVVIKVFRRKHIVLYSLTLLALTSITLFSSITIESTFKTISSILVESSNIYVIYSGEAKLPITGFLPAYLAEIISTNSNVVSVSPEVTVLCRLNGSEIVMVRGIDPKHFTETFNLRVIEGSLFDFTEIFASTVGVNLARKMNITIGSKLVLISDLWDRYVTVTVKGIHKTNTPIDSEILVPLITAQYLRSMDVNYVTIIHVKTLNENMRLHRLSSKRLKVNISIKWSNDSLLSNGVLWVLDEYEKVITKKEFSHGNVTLELYPGSYIFYVETNGRFSSKPLKLILKENTAVDFHIAKLIGEKPITEKHRPPETIFEVAKQVGYVERENPVISSKAMEETFEKYGLSKLLLLTILLISLFIPLIGVSSATSMIIYGSRKNIYILHANGLSFLEIKVFIALFFAAITLMVSIISYYMTLHVFNFVLELFKPFIFAHKLEITHEISLIIVLTLTVVTVVLTTLFTHRSIVEIEDLSYET